MSCNFLHQFALACRSQPPRSGGDNIRQVFIISNRNIFKLSVSNPKIKYVAYLSVLSQLSNSQGLGRKNNFEVLKTDRNN